LKVKDKIVLLSIMCCFRWLASGV